MQLLLDAVVDYLPSPADRPPVRASCPRARRRRERKPDAEGAVRRPGVQDHHRADRRPGLRPHLLGRAAPQGRGAEHDHRPDGAHRPHLPHDGRPPRRPGSGRPRRDRRRRRPEADATPATRCASTDAPITLEEIRFPEPVISQAIIPDRTTDETKLADALGKLVRDDPTLKARTDPETKQLIISRHGRAAPGSVGREADAQPRRQGDGRQADGGLPPDAGASRSRSRRATSSRPAAAASSPSSTCSFEPLTKEQVEEWTTYQEEQGEKPDPNNIYFMDKIVGGVVPDEYIPSVEQGFREATREGGEVRLPVRGHAGDAARRQVPRRRLARRTRSSWRRWSARATPCSRPASRCWSRS